ncbi:hypothetical protein [Actinophytocola xinjiangensis]|uniref:hypothetical protein n=1 Tax=Actinophytocola xinjiangensis TaxID=485602 RepID=UPI0012B841F8|nr:hypothetical protein [Actinophytocola xinjiangensis]
MTELDLLLEEAGKRGYLWHQFRSDQDGPEVLAGVFGWGRCADVVVLAAEEGTHAYRTPVESTGDVFSPARVYWWYGRSDGAVGLPAAGMVLPGVGMVWILRALLTLPAPDEPGGLPPLVSAPKGTGVSGDRVPVRLRRWPGR